MEFKTKLDFSNNRQVKQFPKTETELSGSTIFGVPFNDLETGPDLTTSAVTESYSLVVSTFSGNTGQTIYNWFDSRMSLGEPYLSALTPSNSGVTQEVEYVFTSNTTTVIDGNTVNLTYTGVSFDVFVDNMVDLGGGDYSGSVTSDLFDVLSASTLDYTGRTIWVDVSGITRTDRLIISDTPVSGHVWTCIDSEGMGEWLPPSTASTPTVERFYYILSPPPNILQLNVTGGTGSVTGIPNGYYQTIYHGLQLTGWTSVGSVTLSGLNTSTGVWTVPSNGFYDIYAWIYLTVDTGLTVDWGEGQLDLGIVIPGDGQVYNYGSMYVSSIPGKSSRAVVATASYMGYLNAGDTISIKVGNITNRNYTPVTGNVARFSVHKVSSTIPI